jgi:CRISPR-associated endonuclease/helicase Cas3
MASGTERFISHLRRDPSGELVERQLQDHLRAVSASAGAFASEFEAREWASVAGLWHDLGKFQSAWQAYLRRCQRGDAHDPHESEIEFHSGRHPGHSLAGAQYAEEKLPQGGRLLSYIIAGHHAGLPDYSSADGANASLSARLQAARDEPIRNELARSLESASGSKGSIPHDVLAVPALQPDLMRMGVAQKDSELALSLWIRMLFSCLVDADYLDAERFFDIDRSRARLETAALSDLLLIFNAHMDRLAEAARPTKVNAVRAQVLSDCRRCAEMPPGVFSLTVPTGGGKTLSSLSFALEHARRHSKRRVIYAIPYTSIIEQTAGIFRGIFASLNHAVIEHHSTLDPSRETQISKLAAENWDAPLIVTTNVQLFESLFAARTSRCRKLHNLTNSVLVLDEAQLLPLGYLKPVVQTLKLLVQHYGVTVVLCTATQPALKGQRNAFGHSVFEGIGPVQEIVADPPALYARLQRVDVTLPTRETPALDWPELAEQMLAHQAVMAIVNTRNDAKALWKALDGREGCAVHLSARMCPAHRAQVIDRIKHQLAALRDDEHAAPLRVVSTSLVEAGVDFDFPVVFRSFAGLDSIAQAAGRCNREGLLPALGKVIVFTPAEERGKGSMADARKVTRGLLDAGLIPDPLAPESFEHYFTQLRETVARNHGGKGLDEKDLLGLLKPKGGDCSIAFRTAAEACRLIEDTGQAVVVRWGADEAQRSRVQAALGSLEKDSSQKWPYRVLQRHTVNVPQYEFERMQQQDLLEAKAGVFVVREGWYDDDLGLRDADDGMDAVGLVR